MPEIVGTFARTELWDERANCSSEARNSSRRDLTEERLEFAVRQFDWIEVGRVFRKRTGRHAQLRVRGTRQSRHRVRALFFALSQFAQLGARPPQPKRRETLRQAAQIVFTLGALDRENRKFDNDTISADGKKRRTAIGAIAKSW